MSIKVLVHNLKLLGFDESKHTGNAIQLNELLFTRDTVNNDKAFEYICLFLFRRIDRNRVKRDLTPNLTIRTSGGKLNFIAKVYRWLYELGSGCDLFRSIPLRRSELLTYHGNNVIKIMVTFSTFVLKHTLESKNHNDVLVSAKSSLAEIQDYIKIAHQSFNLTEESKNAYTRKASEAANLVNIELSSSAPQALFPLVTAEETRHLNQDLGFIRLRHESMQNANSDNTPTSTHSPNVHQGSNRQKASISTTETDTTPSSFFMPITPTFDSSKELQSNNLETTNFLGSDPSNINALSSNSNTRSPVKTVTQDTKLISIPSISTITHSIPHYSALDTSYKSSRSVSKETEHISFIRAVSNSTLPSFCNLENSAYVKEPCQLPSFRNHFLENSLTPAVDSPFWFLPPIYNLMTEFDSDSMLLTQHFSPVIAKNTCPLVESSRKRKHSTFEESEEDDEVEQQNVVLPSPTKRKIIYEEMKTPPNQIINLELEDHYESSPYSLENLEVVPPLMEESAPFRRIYQTEYFDIDFLTPGR